MDVLSVGVDPGTTTGVAVVTRNVKNNLILVQHTKVRLLKQTDGSPDWMSYAVQVRSVLGDIIAFDRLILSIEGQYIGSYTTAQGVRRPVSGSLIPATCAGVWMGMAAAWYNSLTIRQYQPDEWRKICWPDMRRMKRAEAKRWAVKWVRMLFGTQVTQDEADAIGLAVAGLVGGRNGNA